jgi:hypothetical protein
VPRRRGAAAGRTLRAQPVPLGAEGVSFNTP